MSAAEAGTRASLSERVLVLVLGARNGKVTHELLLRGGIEAFVCSSVEELCIEIEKGGAAALIAEEALTADAAAESRVQIAGFAAAGFSFDVLAGF